MLSCLEVSKSFGAVKALKGVSFDLAAGSVTALVGDNGAGKSTLIRICATLMRPDSGSVRIDSVDADKARARVGYVGHESMLDQTLTVRENLVFFGRLYGVASPGARADALIERLEARAIASVPVADLSRGQEQLAALGRALVHEPALLLLDEPSTGLDPAAHSRLSRLLKEEASRGACVFYSTHDATLLPAADRTLRLAKGGLS